MCDETKPEPKNPHDWTSNGVNFSWCRHCNATSPYNVCEEAGCEYSILPDGTRPGGPEGPCPYHWAAFDEECPNPGSYDHDPYHPDYDAKENARRAARGLPPLRDDLPLI